MENEEGESIWKSEDSMVSATMGRVMNTLLTARPSKLLDSISRLQSSYNPPNPLALSLENSLRILHKYVGDGAEKEASLDEVLIPIIEHSLRCKESKYKNQELILLNWLFQDEVLFQALARNFSDILIRKEDHHVALGWCILARRLIEYDVSANQFSAIGLKKRYNALLENLCKCSTPLLSLINSGSTVQDGFELPTRLSVAAADCVIALSVGLTRKDMVSDTSENRTKSSKSSRKDRQVIPVAAVDDQKKVMPITPASELARDMEMGLLLWNLLDHLIMLVQKLLAVAFHTYLLLLLPEKVAAISFLGCLKKVATISQMWSRKSRSLNAKGLERVLKWLHETKKQYHSSHQAGPHMARSGILLLSSCWKHYGILMHLEDPRISYRHKELLDQYLSGIEYYTENYTEEHIDDKGSGVATINFFLNCLLLLLGRLTPKQFDSAMTEHRLHISRVVTSQLCSTDEDVIDGAISIVKATIFGTNHSVSGCSFTDNKQMESVLPLLLNLLDERDGTAKAVVTLIAEYCSKSTDTYCLEEILTRLASGSVSQRRNSLDVLSKVIHISSDSVSTLPHAIWEDVSNHLLDCLKDEEDAIRAHAAKLLPLIDPSLVLPSLVRLIYSSDETLHSSASNTLLDVLTYHNQKPNVLCMMLDSVSNLDKSSDLQKTGTGNKSEGTKGEADRVLKLIPEWSKTVTNWNLLIGPLVDKMFAEPSNAVIVKFLSYISDRLAGAADEVFQRLLLHTKSQKEIDDSFLSGLDRSNSKNDVKLQHSLFDRLCPLLIIRLLPLRVFDDRESSLVYGDLFKQTSKHGNSYKMSGINCIAELLLKRAFSKLEFEDVRKLSAELCGRIHPNVLFPAVSSQMAVAINDRDILKIKACLFSICTSLVVRGRESVSHPVLPRIRESIETILLWPSIDGDEISKAQHGCIDCLAIMVCTELQDPEPSRNSNSKEPSAIGFHNYVIDQLTCDISSNVGTPHRMSPIQSTSFRLCMANVLISACQKISDSGRKPFAYTTLRQITRSFGIVKESEIRAACIQVLFSIVYHLKSIVLPYSSHLLKASLQSLKGETQKERMAGAKLLASLMASEEVVVQSISEGLLEARSLLSTISQTDSSSMVRQLCTQLLLCMTSR